MTMQTAQPPPPTTTSVAVIGQAQPSPPVVAVGLNWVVLLPVIFAGIALLINTSVSAWNSIRTKQAGAVRDAKLDNITVLVNGRYSEVLQELADVKRLLAAATGLARDHANAVTAQERADEQLRRVIAAGQVGASPKAAA